MTTMYMDSTSTQCCPRRHILYKMKSEIDIKREIDLVSHEPCPPKQVLKLRQKIPVITAFASCQQQKELPSKATMADHTDPFLSTLLSALRKPLEPKPCPRTECVMCGEQFTSRERLFKHLRAHSHAPNLTSSVLLAELQTLVRKYFIFVLNIYANIYDVICAQNV